jgi:hypothetical protein
MQLLVDKENNDASCYLCYVIRFARKAIKLTEFIIKTLQLSNAYVNRFLVFVKPGPNPTTFEFTTTTPELFILGKNNFYYYNAPYFKLRYKFM